MLLDLTWYLSSNNPKHIEDWFNWFHGFFDHSCDGLKDVEILTPRFEPRVLNLYQALSLDFRAIPLSDGNPLTV